MAKNQNLATLVTLAIVATLLGYATAATYTVGESKGWTYPPNVTFYATWASQHNFTVGDVLLFNFPTGNHTVATVTKASYDSCNITDPIKLEKDGPANYNLTAPGEVNFICTIGKHCSFGSQKFAINVTASPPSGATRTGLASMCTILISAAVCLFF